MTVNHHPLGCNLRVEEEDEDSPPPSSPLPPPPPLPPTFLRDVCSAAFFLRLRIKNRSLPSPFRSFFLSFPPSLPLSHPSVKRREEERSRSSCQVERNRNLPTTGTFRIEFFWLEFGNSRCVLDALSLLSLSGI